ncbi:DEAD DEAH box helicase [Fusarium albosuccineum]|uniref:DEAD DEAH box helicase n=1 Tax=Fusarium albosuccineum TaxID=1237068 RepID=A0A8H4LIZ1_9HYPO|nr:DEAD DEAH box helicase [Fusarium albosuccineum]
MADDAPDASPKTEPLNIETKEDAETRAARRELKQSSISDTTPSAAEGSDTATPAANASDAPDSDLKDQVASPKKKRAHDQLEGGKEAEENDANSVASTDSAKDRASRLEPEKKRHRDEESNDTDLASTAASSQETTKETDAGKSPTKKSQPQTSASAFAASGFGKLSSGASPFASLGGSQGGGSFGGSATAGKPSLSSFASSTPSSATQAPAAAPKLTFGSTSGASPFAGLSSGANGFGSAFGGSAFGSALGGAKPLTSFAAPGGESLKKEKPAKPFGAPESDNEDDDDEDDDGEDNEQPEEAERSLSPEKESEEKKKLKLQKVEVNDGEAGEATILSVRAKMFYHDKEAGWKERGGGMLKINVPQACVEYDENGVVVPGSFDASALEVDDPEAAGETQGHKVARLIMRQDQTHRVILNTALVAAMKFQEKASLKSVGILFTAFTSFDGEQAKPVSITMRMTAANAKSFMNEIGVIQRELQSS